MKRIVFFLMLLVNSYVVLSQQVSNTRFEQDGKQVKIYYDLSETADVSIYLSTDGGNTYDPVSIEHVSGHVGRQVPAGKGHCAVWDVLSDRDKLQGSQVCFKIRAVRQGSNQTFTVGGVNFTMVYVAGGLFTMGCTSEQGTDCEDDEKPPLVVRLNEYYIGETEVTQELWKAVMGSNPSSFMGNNLPVDGVGVEEAQEFIRKLNQLTGRTFRLPTEAEWEFAARGGNKSIRFKYSGGNIIDNVAWYKNNSGGKPHNVKSKSPNELGLYDMSGNVREWCSKWWGSYSNESQTNFKYTFSRGGSWYTGARLCRVSFRSYIPPSYPCCDYGLRLVLLP